MKIDEDWHNLPLIDHKFIIVYYSLNERILWIKHLLKARLRDELRNRKGWKNVKEWK